MVKANGTIAKEVAVYFLEMTNQRFTPSIMSKTIVQAKQLLEAGYTEDEITKSIDWVLNKTSVIMYSLGYINTTINKILKNIEEEENEEELSEKMKRYKEDMEKYQQELVKKEGEKQEDDKSRNRNKEKANRFGDATGFGKKHSFDMLEESGEDN